jgi:hypothetical protein
MAFTPPAERATLEPVRFDLAQWTSGEELLATREQGEAARSALHRELLSSVDYTPVVIDVETVQAMSFPFADSFFGLLLGGWVTGYYDNRSVVVFGANRDVTETIDAVLRLHKMGVVVRSQDGSARLLGGEPALRESVAAADSLGRRFTATELGGALGVTPQAMNNRLKALLRMGALIRLPVAVAGGGREFAYQLADTEGIEQSPRGPSRNFA